MGASCEQLNGQKKHWPDRASARFTKQQTSRKKRRLAKRFMEDAPDRVTKGWAD